MTCKILGEKEVRINDIIGIDDGVKAKVEYIFLSFQKVFPAIQYDERMSIVGIGETGKHLLCYFRKDINNTVWVKFKSDAKGVPLVEGSEEDLSFYIDETIKIFQHNNFIVKTGCSNSNKAVVVTETRLKCLDELFIIDFYDDTTKSEENFKKLLDVVIPCYGDIYIDGYVSRRLTRALTRGEIKKISDLSGCTILKLKGIHYFGKQCFEELISLLRRLEKEFYKRENKIPEIESLYETATLRNVKILSRQLQTCAYLESIDYDDSYFEDGTVGQVLCLRKKQQNGLQVRFANNKEELVNQYLSNEEYFPKVLNQTKELFLYFIDKVFQDKTIENERDKEIMCLRIGIGCREHNLQEIGARFGITRECVRQRCLKKLKYIEKSFNFIREDDRLKYKYICDYLNTFSTCTIDAFVLYLNMEKRRVLLEEFKKVVLSKLQLPDEFNERLEVATTSIKSLKKHLETEQRLNNKRRTIKDKRIEVENVESREDKADIKLFKKLRVWRWKKSEQEQIPAYMIFHNKTLMKIATCFPVTKIDFLKIKGVGENKWKKYGEEILEIIKEYMNTQ